MAYRNKALLRETSPYNASLTSEQFLFYETRITAGLIIEGLNQREIIDRVFKENLFQYPTEKSLKRIAGICCRRLETLNDKTLIHAITTESSETAKQICLYAMMKQHRLVWDFMIVVVGGKYRHMETSFSKNDITAFVTRLREQDDLVATWSDSTISKITQVLGKILAENGYLDSVRTKKLNRVSISPILENAIRSAGQEYALPAFNCLS